MKTTLLITAILLLSISIFSSAQNVITDQKSMGSPGTSSGKMIFVQDTSGWYAVGAIDTTGGRTRIWLIFLNLQTDDTIWTKIYDSGLPGGVVVGTSVAATSDNGLVIGATALGYSSHKLGLIVKTDHDGAFQWAKTVGNSAGMADFENILVGKPDAGSEIIVTGQERFGTDSIKSFMASLDPVNGSIVWYRIYTPTGGQKDFYLWDWDDDGYGYICYGDIYNRTTGWYHAAIIWTDYNGNIDYVEDYGTPTGNYHAYYGKGSPQTGYVFGGSVDYGTPTSHALVTRIDSAGPVNWSKIYSGTGSDYVYSAEQLSLNKFVFAGKTNSGGHGGYDGLLLTTDFSGNLLNARAYGGTADDAFSSLKLLNNKVVALGYTDSYGPGTRSAFITIKVQIDFRLADISGSIPCSEDTVSLTVSNSFISATPATMTADTTGLTFTSVTLTETSGQSTIVDICSTVGINEEQGAQNMLTVFPNPSPGKFTVTFNEAFSNSTLKIFNVLGEQVYSDEISSKDLNRRSKEISLHVSPGIYFIQISNSEIAGTGKLVVDR